MNCELAKGWAVLEKWVEYETYWMTPKGKRTKTIPDYTDHAILFSNVVPKMENLGMTKFEFFKRRKTLDLTLKRCLIYMGDDEFEGEGNRYSEAFLDAAIKARNALSL